MKPRIFYRKRLRVAGYDYASSGAYFVTICAEGRKCIFGTVDGTVVKLTLSGRVVEESWLWLAKNYSFVHLDDWILVPNHLHAIIWLEENCPKSLGGLIGAFKTISSKRIAEAAREPPLHPPLQGTHVAAELLRAHHSLRKIIVCVTAVHP